MCDCVPSPPLSLPGIRCQKIGSHRCDSKLRGFCRTVHPRKTDCCRNTGQTSNSREIVEFRSIRGVFLRNVDEGDRLKSKCCMKVRSESYELFDELEFEDKRGKGFEIETRGGDGETDNDLSSSVKGGIQSSNPPVSTSFDFLEFKGDLDDEKSGPTDLESGDSTQAKCPSDVVSRSEDAGQFLGRLGARNGRQVIRRSNILAKQVISIQSALSLGFISQLWVDTSSWMVVVVEVRPSMLSGEMERFLLEDVCQVGDVVLVQDETVLESDFKMIDLDTLVGYSVVTPSRRSIGKVRGYTFNINSGAVELLELDSFGVSIIPSSLVSTYALFVEDVIEVESDTVVVQEAAASRVQKLTKGFWNAPKIGTIDSEVEYSELERLPLRNRGRRRRKFSSKVKNSDDDWQLPMDYT